MTAPDIIEFVTDEQLLGLSISPAQESLLRVIYGLPLVDGEQRELFHVCTGREQVPEHGLGFSEVTVVSAARSGKDSRVASPICSYEAAFGSHSQHLARGERGTIALVATDQRGTQIAFDYIRAGFESSPVLMSLVDDILAREIRLTNGMSIVCFPCTRASLRGWSIPVAVMDEVGFWRLQGSTDSDVEVQASVRRGMLSFGAPRLVKISTPYLRSGVLWDDFQAAFGKADPDRLVWKATSRQMVPSLPAERLERARRLDPSRFAREYEAEFADDLEAFLPTNWVDDAIVAGRHELPPEPGINYVAAIDSSGGSGSDVFTLSIGHAVNRDSARVVVQDLLRGWKRRGGDLPLEGVVTEIARIVRPYGIHRLISDRYAADWVRQSIERNGLRQVQAPVKSEAYLAMEPVFASGQIEILDHDIQRRELVTLERRLKAGGRAEIDHPRGLHDDYSNALALVVAELAPFKRSPWSPAILLDGLVLAECNGTDSNGVTWRDGKVWSGVVYPDMDIKGRYVNPWAAVFEEGRIIKYYDIRESEKKED